MPSGIIKAHGENLAPWKQIQEHPKQSGRRLGGINFSKGLNLLSLNPSKTLNVLQPYLGIQKLFWVSKDPIHGRGKQFGGKKKSELWWTNSLDSNLNTHLGISKDGILGIWTYENELIIKWTSCDGFQSINFIIPIDIQLINCGEPSQLFKFTESN